MVYQTVSSGSIIGKLYRDFKLSDPSFEADALEWIGEALGHIGVGAQMSRKNITVLTEDHRAELPSDFVRLIEVSYYGVRATLDNYTQTTGIPLDHTSRTNNPALVGGQVPENDGYYVSEGSIITTFEMGVVAIQYYGMVLDEEGYPLIPDHPSFGDALTWYILGRLCLGGWKHPDPSINFSFCEQRWLKYCKQARNKAKMPSVGALDAFMQNYRRVVNLTDRRRQGFNSGGLIQVHYGIPNP